MASTQIGTKEELLSHFQDLLDQEEKFTKFIEDQRGLLPARRDFIMGLFLGLFGNAVITYFDKCSIYFISEGYMDGFNIIMLVLSFCIFLFVSYIYEKRTNKMYKSLEKVSNGRRIVRNTLREINTFLGIEE